MIEPVLLDLRVRKHRTRMTTKLKKLQGKSRLDLLDQCTYWVDVNGKLWKLNDMSIEHRTNLMNWLDRNAERFKFLVEIELLFSPRPYGECAKDAVDEILDDLFSIDSVSWIRSTELYTALIKLNVAERDRQFERHCDELRAKHPGLV